MPNREGFPGPAVSPVEKKRTQDGYLLFKHWGMLPGRLTQVSPHDHHWESLGSSKTKSDRNGERGRITVTIAQISVTVVLIDTESEQISQLEALFIGWPGGPISPGISLGSSVSFEIPDKGLYCHGAHPMAHLGWHTWNGIPGHRCRVAISSNC